jgi:hypothetical protein
MRDAGLHDAAMRFKTIAVVDPSRRSLAGVSGILC